METGPVLPLTEINGPFPRFLLRIYHSVQAITGENEAYVDVTILSFPFLLGERPSFSEPFSSGSPRWPTDIGCRQDPLVSAAGGGSFLIAFSPLKMAVNTMEAASQSPIRLLIVEDSEAASTSLLDYFRSKTPYTTTTVGDAETALRYLSRPPGYDVVLLDVSLPGKSGFELLEEAQALPLESSFLLLSSKDRLQDKLRGFNLGADDYVVKPCAMEELEARVEAVLCRRLAPAADSKGTYTYALDDLTINFASNTCFREGQRVPLTSLEFEILEYLVEQRGRTVPRKELRDAVWENTDDICLRTIDRHVAKIRNKIEQDPELPAYLQTVYGKGYEFTAAEYA